MDSEMQTMKRCSASATQSLRYINYRLGPPKLTNLQYTSYTPASVLASQRTCVVNHRAPEIGSPSLLQSAGVYPRREEQGIACQVGANQAALHQAVRSRWLPQPLSREHLNLQTSRRHYGYKLGKHQWSKKHSFVLVSRLKNGYCYVKEYLVDPSLSFP